MLLDPPPRFEERFHRGIVVGLEGRATFQAAAPTEPAPFSAQHMNQRVPDGSVASSHSLGELFRCELRDHFEESLVGPVAVIVETFQVPNGHLVLLIPQSTPTARQAALLACAAPWRGDVS